jgi:hypothetical protein
MPRRGLLARQVDEPKRCSKCPEQIEISNLSLYVGDGIRGYYEAAISSSNTQDLLFHNNVAVESRENAISARMVYCCSLIGDALEACMVFYRNL